MIAMVIIFVVMWQRYPKHPVLLMVIATTAIVWMDPIMNWAPYAAYNPQLTHFPETWALASLSPTVEPFIGIGYATFYLGAYFPAIWILRRIQARRPLDTFVWRHPLISLGALILVIGFVYDGILESILVRTQLYIYSQVVPFGSLFAGKPYQFPLLWESTFVCWVMIPAGVLLYRDDTGRTQAEKLAQRIRTYRPFRGRPALPPSPSCSPSSTSPTSATAAASPSSGSPGRRPRLPVRGPSPKRRCTTRRVSTPRPDSRVRTWPVSGTVGNLLNRDGPNMATNPDGRCSPAEHQRSPLGATHEIGVVAARYLRFRRSSK